MSIIIDQDGKTSNGLNDRRLADVSFDQKWFSVDVDAHLFARDFYWTAAARAIVMHLEVEA